MKYSLALASYYLVSPAVALHLPFTRRTSNRSGALSKRSTKVLTRSGSLVLDNYDNNAYSSTLNVAGKGEFDCGSVRGSKNHNFVDVPVSLDTGSTDMWLYNCTEGLLDSALIHVGFVSSSTNIVKDLPNAPSRTSLSLTVTVWDSSMAALPRSMSRLRVTLSGISLSYMSPATRTKTPSTSTSMQVFSV